MVVLSDEIMEVDSTIIKKRKSGSFDQDLFATGKRMKFESFPKATSKKIVSAASTTLSQDEDVQNRKDEYFL